ncbi:MAG: hypothetical protein IPG89_08340 [Bacteroidetes bacterium]|nr:hypothetical protein [Bacteroidota bacterium]
MKENRKLPANIFEMILGLEYYTKGIIGFKKQQSEFLPLGSGVTVKIKLEGRIAAEITGTFTRSDSTTKINGKNELIDWYKKNFKQGDKVRVKIESPIYYILSKPEMNS